LLSFDVNQAPAILTHRPKVAILREQGVNGQIEMAAAFDKAGFEAVDVHMVLLILAMVCMHFANPALDKAFITAALLVLLT
jgi:phosphoribosylformylglycinamidine synthase